MAIAVLILILMLGLAGYLVGQAIYDINIVKWPVCVLFAAGGFVLWQRIVILLTPPPPWASWTWTRSTWPFTISALVISAVIFFIIFWKSIITWLLSS